MNQQQPLLQQYRRAWEYLVKWSIISVSIAIPAALSVWALRTFVDILFMRLCGKASALLFFMPAVGGLVVGLILYRIDHRVSGEGVPRYVKAVLENNGAIPFRIWPLKILATITSLGFGGSGGLVGPLAYAGGALGSSVGRALKKLPFLLPLQQSDLKVATVCGVGAALGALLKAPVAGAILAGEILYTASLSYRDLFPAMLASACSYLVYCFATDFKSFFDVAPFANSPQMVGYSALVGLAGGFVGILFVQTLRVVRHGFDRCFLPIVLRPAAGGVIVGILAWLVGREIMSVGRPLFHVAVTG
ncbi:MAG TPA: chloride channel protein, partial [bacterium]|nr:chloride channel protein [bacterium]